MRVLLAGIFAFGSMLGTVGLLEAHFRDEPWPWWAKPLPAIVLLASLPFAAAMFNRPGLCPNLRRKSLAARLAELELKGLLLRQPFQARRAFAVQEFEDEGSTYYIELADGRVLFLSGQYLYDYEPVVDDLEANHERTFPCTEFEILRHKDAGYVLEIRCAGKVLEPELTAAPFTQEDFRRGVPEDGEIITGDNYESIKRARAAVA